MKRRPLPEEVLAGIVLGVMRSTGAIGEEDYRKLKTRPIPAEKRKVTA